MANFWLDLLNFRNKFHLTLEKTGKILGLSKQYLNSLENSGSQKNLSIDKYKDVLVALSQNKISNSQEKFINDTTQISTAKKKPGKKSKDEKAKSYFDINGLPEPEELNLNELKRLLFLSTGLDKYENSFLPVETIVSSKTEIDKFIELTQLFTKNISDRIHNYEVWTVSDILGETLYDESAEKTAQYIINSRVKYINFVPIDDNTQWRTAYQRVKSFVEKEIKLANKDVKKYWQENKWEDYLNFYGITKAAFFVRLRIYNPYSPDATGNFNIGGKEVNTAKFSNMLPSEIPSIVEKLKLVVFADLAKQLYDDENFPIKELGCLVNKKIINSK